MADLARLDAYAAGVLSAGTASALAVALTDRERTLAVRTYGAAAPEALWPIGSIGKAFAAVVALQLVDAGVLALDRPITEDLPWFAVRGEQRPITLHHLLTHTAGLIGTSDLAPASGYDVIALAETELGFAPGEHRLYSDLGYRTIGVLLERVTGRPTPSSSRRACSTGSGCATRRPPSCTTRAGGCRAATSRSTTTGPGPRARARARAVDRGRGGRRLPVLHARRTSRVPPRPVGRG